MKKIEVDTLFKQIPKQGVIAICHLEEKKIYIKYVRDAFAYIINSSLKLRSNCFPIRSIQEDAKDVIFIEVFNCDKYKMHEIGVFLAHAEAEAKKLHGWQLYAPTKAVSWKLETDIISLNYGASFKVKARYVNNNGKSYDIGMFKTMAQVKDFMKKKTVLDVLKYIDRNLEEPKV